MAIIKTDSQHYADIAAAIRSKSGSSALYQPQEMPGAILDLETGSQASAILVYAPTGSDITLTCGDLVRTVQEEDGVWRFENCGLGTWVVTASKDGFETEYTVEIAEQGQLMRYEVQVSYAQIFGISRDITATSPAWTRTDDAVGMTATGSIGTAAGDSDFSNVYPWRDIQRETLSTGDVMVKIPKFWYRRYREGDVEYIKIASGTAAGYTLHPAFHHGGVQQDWIYVGAYKTSSGNLSASGYLPQVNQTRATFRSQAASKGDGWGILDISTLSAIQMLYLVEFANNDSQTTLGGGYAGKTSSDTSLATGTTNSVPNLTGRPAGVTDEVDVVYRGIEGLWGNVFDYVDGIMVDGTNYKYYVCNDPKAYADSVTSDYTCLDYAVADTGTAGRYLTQMGYQQGELDYVMLPTVTSGGSSATYFCDHIYIKKTSDLILRKGGKWHSDLQAGLFCMDATKAASAYDEKDGSRLIYIPQEVSA